MTRPTITILVVEDDLCSRKLVHDILEYHGYVVVEAASAELALDLLDNAKPDLVLADLQLPGMDGIAFAAALHARADCASVPVIAMTASVMQVDALTLSDRGFAACQPKPIQLGAFLELVQKTLASHERGDGDTAGSSHSAGSG